MPRLLLRLSLPGVDEFVILRRGDRAGLVGLGVPAERCRFVALGAPKLDRNGAADGDYIYAGGAAQRDWITLEAALRLAGLPSVVACPEPDLEFSSNVQNVGIVTPDVGRAYLSGASALVQSFQPTALPSGPLLILDAFALGKPVISTDVGASRDYVEDGVNGLLVPPRDHIAACGCPTPCSR